MSAEVAVMDSPGPSSEQLADENRELQLRLAQLSASHRHLERRLQRVENSVIFRFLRRLGPRLAALGLPVPNRPRTQTESDYSSWAEETALWNADGCLPPPASAPAVTILFQAAHPDRLRLARALASIRDQQYPAWELFVSTGANPPDWLPALVRDSLPAASVEILPTMAAALEHCRGDVALLMNADAVLEPGALACFTAALDPATVAVYSDWDCLQPDGRRHSPRFTPEFSPELLSQTLYWGRCFLISCARLREISWPSTATPEHDAALRLSEALRFAETTGNVCRVPRILWHSQLSEPAAAANRALPRVSSPERASVIICSRSPRQLERCLNSLRPTLDPRHEIVIVAHQAGDGAGLESVARRYGARLTPYSGAFHFGAMNAQGIRESTGEVICLLNDDVFPVASGWLERMLSQTSRPDVGVVGALLLYPDGSIQHAGIAVGARPHPAHVGRFQKESPYWPWLRMSREVTAVTGACMVLRRAVWDELGGFDRRFPVNYNDIDLCLRAWERGYRVLLETGAVLIHHESRTRIAAVRPEEAQRFHDRWYRISGQPDRFFNPQLSQEDESIELPAPWTEVR